MVKINDKYNLIVPEHREQQWSGKWEEARLDSMHSHLTKKDVMIYVGAEQGDMPALCAKWGAKVVLVEPSKGAWASIKATFEANDLKPLESFAGFASDQDLNAVNGRFIKYPPFADRVIQSEPGFKELHEPYDETGQIPQVKIDSIPVIPTAISIDVEGSEFKVLRGAEKTLKTYHPKIWLSVHPEFMYRIYKEYQYDLRNWIKALGYKETILDYQHELHVFYEAVK